MNNLTEIEELIKIISKLPGLGPKSAKRIVLKLINNREELIKPMAKTLTEVYKNVSRCKICGTLKSKSIECSFSDCNFIESKFDKICVVENISDQWSIESSNIYNLIRDAFPGGSITGAPKLRAMEIIEELEPDERSIYCGSIGYISFDEKTDLNISIRSMLSINNNLYFWGGGGIVYDSDIRSEYNETISKVKPLLDAFSD